MSLLVAIFGPRLAWLSRVPGPMLAMTVATVAQAIGQFDGVTTIGTAFGGIPRGLPSLTFPDPSYERVITLIPAAFTIAMLGAIESLLSAVVADGMAGTRHDSNQELIGQGIANIVTPFFGGFAATGAIARTATNIRNGANSPLAGIVHALTLALILVFFAPWVAHVPLCSLAAILFLVAWNMSEARHFVRMVRTAPRPDVVILLITFSLTVLSDLVIAVNVGVILSMLLFVRRMASSVEVVQVPRQDLAHDLDMDTADDVPADVLVFSIEGPAFFGAVENLERVLSQTHTDPGAIVIRLNRVPFMDATGLQSLTECIDGFSRRNIPVVLCEARSNVLRKLIRAGLLRRSDRTRRHFRHLRNAIHHLERQGPAPRPGDA
jgi:SulP family sulfate permease